MDAVADRHTISVDTHESHFTLRDWLGFLVGRREAIMRAAGCCPNLIWIGLVFVLSAGLAREYDGAYWLGEWWHFLLPLVASLGTSAVLYFMVIVAADAPAGDRLASWRGYRTLLSFYWLTAPLAWLYAVPVERFLDPADAVRANYFLLAVVSIWRVLIITRALSVWLRTTFLSMLIIVLFFADTVAIVAAVVTPTPILNIMGGIRMSEQDDFVLGVEMMLWFFGGIAWFALLIAGAVLSGYRHKHKSHEHTKPLTETAASSIGWSPIALAVLSIAAGGLLLSFAQSEQKHRWRAEQLLRAGQLSEAVAYVESRSRESFPPHWDPPPRTAYGEDQPRAADVYTAIKEAGGPDWFRKRYLEKLLTQHVISEAVTLAEYGDPSLLFDIFDYLQFESRADEFEWHLRDNLERSGEQLTPEVRQRIAEFLGEPE
jgi:hypothetical protein